MELSPEEKAARDSFLRDLKALCDKHGVGAEEFDGVQFFAPKNADSPTWTAWPSEIYTL